MGTEGEMLQAPTPPQGLSSWRAHRSGLGEPGWSGLPLSFQPTSEKGVLVLWVTCIGELGGAYTLGPTRTDLSGNPAQRYLRLLVNVAKKCHGRGPPFGDLSKAEKGDKDAVPEIRQILDEHPDLAWQFVDVAQVAEE